MSKIKSAILFSGFSTLLSTCVAVAELQPKKMSVQGISSPIQIAIATSVLGDTKFEHGIYLFKIHCALDSCSLERLSLNECTADKEGKSSFKPSVYTWSSEAGFLEATLVDNVLELIVFQGTHHQLPAKMNLSLDFSTPRSVQLKSLKATGFIDFNKWPDTETRIEYIPLVGEQYKQLDCPVLLPGIKQGKNFPTE